MKLGPRGRRLLLAAFALVAGLNLWAQDRAKVVQNRGLAMQSEAVRELHTDAAPQDGRTKGALFP